MTKRFSTTKVEVEGREETRVVELPSRNPAPWTEDADLHVVGQRVQRMDALEKVTGTARYTADMQLPGMLHAALLRVPVPRDRVTQLDLTAAIALDGVRGAITVHDLPTIKIDGVRVFDHDIHYTNQCIAAVAADTLEIAERALHAIVCDVDQSAHVLTASEALAADAPKLRPHGNAPRNTPRVISRGDVDAGLRDADVTINAGMIASVSGIFSLTAVPWPGRLCTSTVPPIFSMFVFTTSSPTPRPETLVTVEAVENPGAKISWATSCSKLATVASSDFFLCNLWF